MRFIDFTSDVISALSLKCAKKWSFAKAQCMRARRPLIGLIDIGGLLLFLPSNPGHPDCPLLDVFSIQKQIYTVPIFCQVFVGCNAMDKAMARTTQPGNLVQHPTFMPSSLDSFGMHSPRNQMMIGQRQLLAITNLAFMSFITRIELWWSGNAAGNVCREHWL